MGISVDSIEDKAIIGKLTVATDKRIGYC